MKAKAIFNILATALAWLFHQFTIADLFCVGGFVLLGAGLWEVSRPLALCVLGALMLGIWLFYAAMAIKKGADR